MSRSWDIDIKSCSPETLLDLAQQLKGSEYKGQLLEIQRELIDRARTAGATDQEIVNLLIQNMWKGERAVIAKEWSEAIGISEAEFLRIANVR